MEEGSSKRNILMISSGGSFLAPFMVSALIVAIPAVGSEFSLDAAAMSRLTAVFFLAASMFLIPLGRLADIVGVKKVFSTGIAIYFLSALLAALAPGVLLLVGARFLTGIGAAMIFGTSFALLSLSLSEKERGEALGINIASNLTGFALGFLLGGIFTHYASWRLIFLFTLPISALVLVLIRTRLPGECAYSRGQKFDLTGSGMIVASFFLLVLGLSELPLIRGGILIVAGIMMLILYAIYQKRSRDSPVIDLSLFWNNRCFAFSNAAIMIFTTSNLAVVFLFSLYLQYARGLDSSQTGVILLASSLVMAVLVVYAGRLSDSMNPYRLAGAGAAISLSGLLAMTFISKETPLFLAILEMVLVSAGGSFFYPAMMRIILGALSRNKYGLGSSLAENMRLLGNAASTALVTVGFTIFLGGMDLLSENYQAFIGSMRMTVSVYFVLCAVSLLLIVLAARSKRQKRAL